MVCATAVSPSDTGWLVDMVTEDRAPLTLVTEYTYNPRHNIRQDIVLHAARAEAIWRGCRVQLSGGTRRLTGRRNAQTLMIEPPPSGPDGEGAGVPRRPRPWSPSRAQRLQPPSG